MAKDKSEHAKARHNPAVKPAVIGAAGAVVAAVVAVVGTALGAQYGRAASTPAQVRIAAAAWVGDGHEVRVDGQTLSVGNDQSVWLFTSREDHVGGVYPARSKCSVDNWSGDFTCSSWAGSADEYGQTYILSVAILSSEQAEGVENLLSSGGTYREATAVPHVDSAWGTDAVLLTR